MKNMFLAKPNAMNFNGCKRFYSVKEAMIFLEKTTEYKMPLRDWIEIGKIMKTDSVGNTFNFTDKELEALK